MSSLIEEFQDIDNFKLIPGDGKEHRHYNYNEQPFDEAVEFEEEEGYFEEDKGNYQQASWGVNKQPNGFFGEIDSQESHHFPPGMQMLSCSWETQ